MDMMQILGFVYDMFANGVEVSWPAMALVDETIGKVIENGYKKITYEDYIYNKE